MGEYYKWVNVDKKEFISPLEFDLAPRLHQTMEIENTLLRALRALLASDWEGCHIIFLGDECHAPASISNAVFDALLKQAAGYPGYLHDTIIETYKNISCLFKDAVDEEARIEIEYYAHQVQTEGQAEPNEYRIEVGYPINDLFTREGKTFKYTINHTKKVCYSLEETEMHYKDVPDGWLPADPLPLLLGYGRTHTRPGEWVGDIIGVSDTVPANCSLLKEIHLEWYP